MKKIGIINGVTVYASQNKVRVGPRGPGTAPEFVFGMFPKGDARQLRKMLSKAGLYALASAPRIRGWASVEA